MNKISKRETTFLSIFPIFLLMSLFDRLSKPSSQNYFSLLEGVRIVPIITMIAIIILIRFCILFGNAFFQM